MITFLLAVIFIALVAMLTPAASRKRIKFGKIKVRIHRIKNDGTYEQIFKALSRDLDKLCFTKNQIELFLQQRPDWFRKSRYITLFLLKDSNHFSVGRVSLYSGKVCYLGGMLKIDEYAFKDEHIWKAKRLRRVVVPA